MSMSIVSKIKEVARILEDLANIRKDLYGDKVLTKEQTENLYLILNARESNKKTMGDR